MINKYIKLIFVLTLTFYISTTLNAQSLLDDPHWDNFNQGKDSLCNNLFKSILSNYFYDRPSECLTFNYYSIGYLKNINSYYVSYQILDEATIDFITELFKIDSLTDVSNFAYTKTEIFYDDSKPNHYVIQDIGKLDSFDDYLVIYDEKHITVYQKDKYKNLYKPTSKIGNILQNNEDEEFIYDRTSRQIIMKRNSLINNQTKLKETYKIIDGHILLKQTNKI